uniref:RING-type domain-containing protein n=1 Tax=Glossina brevipalpis TaxID=37001 RepID=A0A1A9W701_9MUSC
MESSEIRKSQANLLLEKYLGLLPSSYNANKVSLQGPIKIENKWIHTKIQISLLQNLKNIGVQTQHHHHIKIKRISEISKLMEGVYIENQKNGNNNMDQSNITSNIIPTKQKSGSIYTEIASLLSEDCKIYLDKNHKCLRFEIFACHKDHYLELSLPSMQALKHTLPDCIDLQALIKECKSLKALLQKFSTFLEGLKPFYENLADIDELCHVVQPSKITTKENWRTIVLKERAFLKIEFKDPFAPLNTMMVNIIGPTGEVGTLRRIFNDGLHRWDGDLNVHRNLLRVFDLCFFPMSLVIESETALIFCNICCSHKSEEGDIPMVSCDNPNCSLIFHASCLKKWFSSLKDGQIFLNVAFGTCPFCKTKLSTSFKELFE